MKVLVLEDEVIIALGLEATLLDLGAADVALTASVQQALALLSVQPVDVVLLDYYLGAETAEPVLQWLAEHATPFLLMTGHANPPVPPEGVARYVHLTKPAAPAAIQAALCKLGIL